MGVVIREADLERDRQVMVDLLRSTRGHDEASHPYEARAEWLYLKNPAGRATAWLVADEKTGQAAGFTVGLPRRMRVEGRDRTCWNCGDFSIAVKYRTLGVAAKLRRGAKESVDAGRVDFLYAHPNERMLSVHQQVGHHVIGRMERYAKPLRARTRVIARLGRGVIGRGVATAADAALALLSSGRMTHKEYDWEVRPAVEFGDEFADLYARTAGRWPVSGVRDGVYLRWRYGENPLHRSEVLHLRTRAGRLAGWIVFSLDEYERTMRVYDLLCESEDGLAADMVRLLAREARRRGAETLSSIAFAGSGYVEDLRIAGLRPRADATSSVVAYAPAGGDLARTVLDGTKWYMTVGDRDV